MTPTDEQALQDCIDAIRLYADVDCLPDIDAYVPEIAAKRRIARVWEPSTDYVVGDVIQPTVRNGRWYRCCVAGTSSATEPTWPRYPYGYYYFGSGSTEPKFDDAGPDWNGRLYDIRGAIHDAWSLKASKASHLVTQSAGNARIEAGALHENCRARAKEFASLVDSVRS